jgi:hypothetical protein
MSRPAADPHKVRARQLAARVRFLRRTLRELEETFKLAIDRSSFTPAVAAKAKALAVHQELEDALAEQAAHKAAKPAQLTDEDTLQAILQAVRGLPVSVLEQIRAAIDEQL